jgi:hypothetical protein
MKSNRRNVMDIEAALRVSVLVDLAIEQAGIVNGLGMEGVRQALALARARLDEMETGLVGVPGNDTEAPW